MTMQKREEYPPDLVKQAPRITPGFIQETEQRIALLQGMVHNLLIREIDYGRIPGTPSDSLWDPGASQIFGAFNCYPGERRIIKFEDTGEKISICIEVPIISRETGQVVATGVGAASTLESKYKYRWEENPADCGYDEKTIKTLKTKLDKGITKYRINNPEHSELLNTIIKMASKRAEVDAAESLPGVASVLRIMFAGPKRQPQETPRWDRFWGEVTRLGLSEEEVHQKLGVASMKNWLSSGKSLDQALDVLRGRQPTDKSKRGPDSIKTFGDLYKACLDDFNLDRQAVWDELNVSSQEEISGTPSDCYRKILVVRS